ncbi:LysM peptidoglycan-binding domain-containing protein [Prochlorococcus marinus]|uniref:LysM domain-containing protein n=1 Tax=Prochlorococcus marinus (strain MIT 9211) TaxID=93059 RepID=A9BDY8_PROM4|nr:LysM peptidoglycan-binding domain-containing protein [Prochlorococcus marinus]ABX08298.1 Hypothetical protein P9211_03671 [Prochlorococcus marinus str. MIT 9211]
MQKLIALLTLFYLTPIPSFAQSVTVNPGDTLSKIASLYEVSIRSIMDLNQIYDADALQVGQRIKLPENAKSSLIASDISHIVKSGESIEEIASNYNVKGEDIIRLNRINNPNYLYIGQKLIMPQGALGQRTSNSNKKKSYKAYHVISKGESLGMISKAYNIPIKDLISNNNIYNPNVIQPGSKLYLVSKKDRASSSNSFFRKNSTEAKSFNEVKWRDYGHLKVKWSSWKQMDGSYVAPALNMQGNPLFIAVNCPSHKLNSTGKGNKWKDWIAPSKGFEFNLLDDLCR